jgi:hypothetical protein
MKNDTLMDMCVDVMLVKLVIQQQHRGHANVWDPGPMHWKIDCH